MAEDNRYKYNIFGDLVPDGADAMRSKQSMDNNTLNKEVYDLRETINNIESQSGESQSGSTVHTVAQASSFSLGDIIVVSPGPNYSLARANSAAVAEAIGMVIKREDESFTYCTGGYVKVTGFRDEDGDSLRPGTIYYLSEDNYGKLSKVKPTTEGSVVKPVLIADSEESGIFLNYRGIEIEVLVKDEDDMISNSDTHMATQQSIKAYSDANLAEAQAYVDTNYVPYTGATGDVDLGANNLDGTGIVSASKLDIGNSDDFANLRQARIHSGEVYSGVRLTNATTGTGFNKGFEFSTSNFDGIINLYEDGDLNFYTDNVKRMALNDTSLWLKATPALDNTTWMGSTDASLTTKKYVDDAIAAGGSSNVEDGTADGQQIYWDNTAGEYKHTEASEFVWDDTNKRLGIGNASPDSELEISHNYDGASAIYVNNSTSGTNGSALINTHGSSTTYSGILGYFSAGHAVTEWQNKAALVAGANTSGLNIVDQSTGNSIDFQVGGTAAGDVIMSLSASKLTINAEAALDAHASMGTDDASLATKKYVDDNVGSGGTDFLEVQVFT